MKKAIWSLLLMVLFLSACSTKEKQETSADANPPTAAKEESIKKDETESQSEEVKEISYEPKEAQFYEIEDPGRPLTDLEQELLRYPGNYSGNDYDERKVEEALDQLPGDLTKEQYLLEMIHLLSEDYHEELETLLRFDPHVEVNVERPDESVDMPSIQTAHYAILIDASGSMKAMSGNKTRMEAAKEAVLEFAGQIPENATISMRVYGHKGSGSDADKKLSCESTENFYNDTFEPSSFQTALDKIKPAGWTPIGLALETVKEDIPEQADHVVVYVVSDGIETCGGDPVQAAKDLVSEEIETVVNIIGFDVDNEGQKLLKEVATAGNGQYTYVNSEQELKKYLRAQYEEIQKAWVQWKEAGKKAAREQKEEKKRLASETKESMKKKSNREKERMKKAHEYLKGRFKDDLNHPTRSMFSDVVNYSSEKWRYAVDHGNQAWRESVDSGNEKWREFVDEGNEKIRETIDKKNQ